MQRYYRLILIGMAGYRKREKWKVPPRAGLDAYQAVVSIYTVLAEI
jgi:hypothetical protein